jgi:MoaA/NifB/PqqE/SkfB family radical SAM enzyme
MRKEIETKVISTTYLKNPGKLKPQKSFNVINSNGTPAREIGYHVTFRITEACDLACDYCDWHGGAHYKYEDIIGSVDVLFEFLKKEGIKSVVFYYHGGEASRHPKIIDILKYIHDKGKQYNIVAYNELQTNLTLPLIKMKEILPHADFLNITFHYLELTKRRYKLESFLKTFDYIKENNIKIANLDVMLEKINPSDVNEFRDIILGFIAYDNIRHCEMIYRFGYDFDFNDETTLLHYEFYKKYSKSEQRYEIDGEIYTTNDLFHRGADFTGWHCEAGKRHLYVNGDGTVYQCGIAMTNKLHDIDNGIFTRLLTDKLAIAKLSILRKSGTICRWDYCGGDFYIPKEKK